MGMEKVFTGYWCGLYPSAVEVVVVKGVRTLDAEDAASLEDTSEEDVCAQEVDMSKCDSSCMFWWWRGAGGGWWVVIGAWLAAGDAGRGFMGAYAFAAP